MREEERDSESVKVRGVKGGVRADRSDLGIERGEACREKTRQITKHASTTSTITTHQPD